MALYLLKEKAARRIRSQSETLEVKRGLVASAVGTAGIEPSITTAAGEALALS